MKRELIDYFNVSAGLTSTVLRLETDPYRKYFNIHSIYRGRMWLKCIFVVLRLRNVYVIFICDFSNQREIQETKKKTCGKSRVSRLPLAISVDKCFLGLEMHWVNECVHLHIHTQTHASAYFYVEHFKTKTVGYFHLISFRFQRKHKYSLEIL